MAEINNPVRISKKKEGLYIRCLRFNYATYYLGSNQMQAFRFYSSQSCSGHLLIKSDQMKHNKGDV